VARHTAPDHPRRVPRGVAALAAVLAASAPVAASASAWFGASAEGGVGLLQAHSAETMPRGLVSVSLTATTCDLYALSGVPGGAHGRVRSVRLAGSVGVTRWLEVAADASILSAALGDHSASGLANPAASVKVGLPVGPPWLLVAVAGRVELPLADELVLDAGGGERVPLGGGSVDASAMALATVDLTSPFPARVHVNVGWAFHGSDDRGRRVFPGAYPAVPEGGAAGDNDAVLLRAAVEFPGRRVSLFTEFRGDVLVDRGLVALRENPLALTQGVRVRHGAWSATGALTVGLSGDDPSTPGFDPLEAYPDWQFEAGLSWGWRAFREGVRRL